MENVSDKELRKKLAAKGHSVGPITNTTRCIYHKLYMKLIEDEEEITVKRGSPILTPKADPPHTPVLRSNKLKRSPLTDDEKLSEATFSVPDEKKKKIHEDTWSPYSAHHTPIIRDTSHTIPTGGIPTGGIPTGGIPTGDIPRVRFRGIPTYQVPSLRRSTIERTALSKRLADEAVSAASGSTKKGSLRIPGVRVTETSSSLKEKIVEFADGVVKRETKVSGFSNTNRLNVTVSGTAPGYMRATNSTMKKDNQPSKKSTKPELNTTRSRMRRSIRLAARRSIRRAGTPTPVTRRDYIPKIGGSNIRKAKDTSSSATKGPAAKGSAVKGAAVKGAAASGKKKRAPWDVKGRLEDVTTLYNDLKEEKATVDMKLRDLSTDLEQKTGDVDMLNIENGQLKESLARASGQLSETSLRCTEQQFKLDEAVIERNEKVSSYERIKRERDEIEEDFHRTKSKLREAENRVDDLERDVRRANNASEELEEKFVKSKKHGNELEDRIEELKQEIELLKGTISCKDNKISELEKTLEKERGEKGDVHNILRRKERQIETLDAKIVCLEQTITELRVSLGEKSDSIHLLEGSLDKEQRNHRDINRVLSDREAHISDLDQKLAVCLDRLHAGEYLRRKLHNTIQELKGNIRVYCRVRPFLCSEVVTGQPTDDIPQMEFSKDNSSVAVSCLQAEKLGRKGETVNHEFSFDHVFGPRHTQEDTFAEVAGLVQSALDGFNVCIFAYGQTGSGKTHTMQGPIDPSSELRGVIPRAMDQVFETGVDLAEQGWQYVFNASFIEIYNENLHDLIGSGGEKIEIKLVNEKTRDVQVTNVRTVTVSNCYDVHELLLKANKNRTVAATKCNERSSRSHSVFRLKIEGKNTRNGDSCTGNLNLVDLAGSERVAHSGSTGQRLKEAQAINTSLSELGNVMMALQERKTHIPYRNSKLTYLLCNSLGGNSKTLMFVNVSPMDKHTAETINSLRFASKVNRVDLGSARKNK